MAEIGPGALPETCEMLNQSVSDDRRANLLLSLKPFLCEEKSKKLDDMIKLISILEIGEMFLSSGGEEPS